MGICQLSANRGPVSSLINETNSRLLIPQSNSNGCFEVETNPNQLDKSANNRQIFDKSENFWMNNNWFYNTGFTYLT